MIVLTPAEMAALDASLDAARAERDAARAEVKAMRADARLGALVRGIPKGGNLCHLVADDKWELVAPFGRWNRYGTHSTPDEALAPLEAQP
jgi:hypothetical protein